MTRKEELEQKANKAVDIVYERVDRNADLDEYDRRECVANICAMFFQVEREVLSRVVDKIELEMEKENESTDDQIWEIRDWCKSQQQELT